MSNIPSANNKIQLEATQYLKPTSESLFQTIGGSVNYALDQVAVNAAAISTETSNRINADNALDGRLDALRWYEPTAMNFAVSSEITLNAPDDSVTYSLNANQEHLITIIFEPTNPGAAGINGWIAVYLNNTVYAGQVILQQKETDLSSFYTVTGINGGCSVSFYVPVGGNSPVGNPVFPNGTDLRIRIWDCISDYKAYYIRRSFTPKTGA